MNRSRDLSPLCRLEFTMAYNYLQCWLLYRHAPNRVIAFKAFALSLN